MSEGLPVEVLGPVVDSSEPEVAELALLVVPEGASLGILGTAVELLGPLLLEPEETSLVSVEELAEGALLGAAEGPEEAPLVIMELLKTLLVDAGEPEGAPLLVAK